MRARSRRDRAGTAPPSTDKDNRSGNCKTKTDNVSLSADHCGGSQPLGASSLLFPAIRAQKSLASDLDRTAATDTTVRYPHIFAGPSRAQIRDAPDVHAQSALRWAH